MNNTEKNFIQGLKNIRLDSEAKLRIREQLVAYSELHSMPAVEKEPFNGLSFVTSVFGHSRRLLATTLALAVLVVGGGASTLAAENAVPGEVLYPVKIGINEPVAAVLAGSGEAQARHHARLALRRVQEAELLRSRGALTLETEEELSARIDAETSRVLEEAGKLALAGDVSASVAVRTELVGELSVYVETVDSGAEAAPMMAKSASPTMETSAMNQKNADLRTVRGVLRKKLALLKISAGDIEQTRALATDNETDDQETATAARSAHALLSGASVSQSDGAATTTATSSRAFGKKFIEELRARDDKQHIDEPKAVPVEETPEGTLPVTLPARVPVKIHIGL